MEEGRFPSPEAKRRLEELIKRMRSEAPEDRPSLFFFRRPFPKPPVLPRLRSNDRQRSLRASRRWSLRPSLLPTREYAIDATHSSRRLEALRALDDAEPAPATAERGVHRKQRKRAGGVLALLKSVDPGKKRV